MKEIKAAKISFLFFLKIACKIRSGVAIKIRGDERPPISIYIICKHECSVLFCSVLFPLSAKA